MNNHNLYHEGTAIRKDEEMVMLDFSNEKHRNYVLAELGGEEYFRTAFPELYGRYQAAVLRDMERAENPEVQVGEPDVFQDAVDIFYGFYDAVREHAVCKGVTSIQKEADNICQRIHVYDDMGNLIIATGNVKPKCRHAVLELDEKVELSETQKQRQMIFDYFSLWYTGENGLKAAYYSTQDRFVWNAADYVEEVRMINPVHKRTAEDSPIVVCYNRTSQTGEKIDYDEYEEAFDPVTHRQRLYLDVGADVCLTENAGQFSGLDITKFLLKLDCQSGIAYYKKDGRVQEILEKFKVTKKGFSFQLDKDWKGVVPAARLPMVEPLDFLMRMEFESDDYRKRGRIIVASDAASPETGGVVKSISRLHLLWGCVADNTLVLMRDGTYQSVNRIRVGDIIETMDEGTGMVKDVIRGREREPLLCIETLSGRSLCCTKYHPILTKRGFVTAGNLNGTDEVRIVKGTYESIAAIYPKEYEGVCNLLVCPETGQQVGTWICNGFITGDFAVQNQLTNELMEKKEKAVTEVTEETEELMRFFRMG